PQKFLTAGRRRCQHDSLSLSIHGSIIAQGPVSARTTNELIFAPRSGAAGRWIGRAWHPHGVSSQRGVLGMGRWSGSVALYGPLSREGSLWPKQGSPPPASADRIRHESFSRASSVSGF